MSERRLGLSKVVEEYEKKKREKVMQEEKEKMEQEPQQKQERKIVKLPEGKRKAKNHEKHEKTEGVMVVPALEKKTVSAAPVSSKTKKKVVTPLSSSKMKKAFETKEKGDFQTGHRCPPTKKQKLEETHKRFTNYLDNELYHAIQLLKNEGEVQSMTAVLDAAVYEYWTGYTNLDR